MSIILCSILFSVLLYQVTAMTIIKKSVSKGEDAFKTQILSLSQVMMNQKMRTKRLPHLPPPLRHSPNLLHQPTFFQRTLSLHLPLRTIHIYI